MLISPRSLSAWLVVPLLSVSSVHCRGVDSDTGAERQSDQTPQSGDVGFYADDQTALRRNADFFFRIYNRSFTKRLEDLPEQGQVDRDKIPYSGYWYPESRGGTDVAVSGRTSPLAKYDQAFHGGRDRAVQWERQHHNSEVSWSGHCNGFAAAAQRHPREPEREVVRNGVTFTPRDIKALMAELYMSADFIFLGGRRCRGEGGGRPQDRSDPTVMGDCEDINPATMHAAIANWIGIMKHTVIMDVSVDLEVWNYPFFQYQVTQQGAVSREEAANLVAGRGDYVFNPAASSFVHMTTRLTYANALNSEGTRPYQSSPDPGRLNTPKDLTLSYVLELNGAGEILGGEWVDNSQLQHPDFLWVALPPLTPNETREMGNPHIDADEVLRLWAESAGFDPDDPPTDITRPADDDQWGRWSLFTVTLDGTQKGSVFSGKDIEISISRRGEIAGSEVKLELKLDGTDLATLDASGDSDMGHKFKAPLGLHRLDLRFTAAGRELADESLRFHVVP